jgi:hypothetical protein
MSQGTLNRSRAAASYGRRRAANACSICRSRKTKCDNQRPECGFCAATGGDCRYADSDPSQFDRATLALLQRLGDLESGLVSHIDQRLNEYVVLTAHGKQRTRGLNNGTSTVVQNRVYEGPSPTPWESGTFRPTSSGIDAATGYGFEPGHVPSDMNGDEPPSSTVLRQVSEMFSDSVLKWPIFSHAAPHLENELQTPVLQVWAQATTSNSSYSEKKRTLGLNLDSDVIHELVENFLSNNHVKNPILDVDSLRADTRDFGETGAQWDERSCLVVRSS